MITDEKIKFVPHILTENEVRKLSDEEIDKYCSEIIKSLVETFEEAGEFENY